MTNAQITSLTSPELNIHLASLRDGARRRHTWSTMNVLLDGSDGHGRVGNQKRSPGGDAEWA